MTTLLQKLTGYDGEAEPAGRGEALDIGIERRTVLQHADILAERAFDHIYQQYGYDPEQTDTDRAKLIDYMPSAAHIAVELTENTAEAQNLPKNEQAVNTLHAQRLVNQAYAEFTPPTDLDPEMRKN